jgi:phytoene dehydrogenase-like protein
VEGKSIIIIGAGIAGLSAGCYGQMNNYPTRIFEMHNLPGGLCTSWKRQGYTIDGCLHWLVGSSPGSDFYRFWEELGAIQGKHIINHEEYARFEDNQGKIFILYTNIDRLEKHLLELAPEDEKVIKELTKGIRDCTRIELPIEKAPELFGSIDGLKMLLKMFPFIAVLNKWRKISIQDFSARFSNPLLREAFPLIGLPWLPEFTMLSLLMTLAWLHKESAGYPLGGSLAFSRSIEQRYLGLGGDLHYNLRVVKILVENNHAVGIRLVDGSEYRADYIVSAADGHTTIFNLLDGKYVDEKIRDYYDNLPVFPPLIHVALGVNCSFEEMPHTVSGLSFPLDKPVVIAGKEWQRLGVHIYNFDPTFAEAGKTVLKVILTSDYNYWQSLREDPERYRAEKEKISDQVVSLLDKRFPGMAAQVEMRDVATPVTFQRYTGNWQGTFEGWMVTPETWNLRMKKTLSGLDNFYMVGQWVEPGGGLPPAAYSGRNLIQILCKGDRRKFITTVPKAV